MQDYHIYSHYVEKQNVSKTSPKFQQVESKAKSVENTQKEKSQGFGNARKIIGATLVTASKINKYVGEYTENTVSAGRRQVGLTYAGMAAYAFTNPLLAAGAAAVFTTDRLVSYNIRVGKENLSADFMRQLSGGTISTGR